MNDFDLKSIIERVREQADIVQIISQHVALDRHNKALCP